MSAVPAISRSEVSAADLAQSLHRLSTQPDVLAKERRVLPKHPRERLERLLQEIDEIILPRVLYIEAGNQDIATLHVANRQIQSLKLVNSNLSDHKHAELEAQAVASGIVAATKKMTGLRVSSRSPDQNTPDVPSGMTLDELRTALGLTPANDGIEQLARLLDPICLGRLNSTGDAQTEFSGNQQWRDVLNQFSEHLSKNIQPGRETAPLPNGLAIPLSEKKLLIAVFDTKQTLLWVVDHDAGLKAISDWQALTPSNAL